MAINIIMSLMKADDPRLQEGWIVSFPKTFARNSSPPPKNTDGDSPKESGPEGSTESDSKGKPRNKRGSKR